MSDAKKQDEAVDSDDEGGGKWKKVDRLMAVCLVQCHEKFYYRLLDESEEEQSGSMQRLSEGGVV